MVKKDLIAIICAGLITSFGVLVWPGLYHYDKLDQKLPVKINRITGDTQVLTSKGWMKLGDYQPPAPKPPEPPKENEGFAIFDKKPSLAVENTKAESEGYGYVYVTGEVKNTGESRANAVSLNVTLYDGTGAVSGTGSTLVYGIEPTQAKGFRISVEVTKAPKGPWQNFKINIVKTY